jgi:hypothetical protein
VQNGVNRESYICAPHCQPTVDLADATKVVGERIGSVSAHAGYASSAPGVAGK